MKQTAVEWYENEINALFDKYENKEISESEFLIMKHNLFYPAKEKEKERMFEVYHGYQDYLDNEFKNQCGGQSVILTFEEYYNETFNTKEK